MRYGRLWRSLYKTHPEDDCIVRYQTIVFISCALFCRFLSGHRATVDQVAVQVISNPGECESDGGSCPAGVEVETRRSRKRKSSIHPRPDDHRRIPTCGEHSQGFFYEHNGTQHKHIAETSDHVLHASISLCSRSVTVSPFQTDDTYIRRASIGSCSIHGVRKMPHCDFGYPLPRS